MSELGVSVPLPGLELHEHRAAASQLRQAGFGGFWTGEVNGTDGISPLAVLSAWEPTMSLSCGVVSAFTRGPAVLAQTAAALGELAPDHSRFGIGTGSGTTVSSWNGMPFDKPYTRVKETLRFLREVLADGHSHSPTTTFSSDGFRLARTPRTPPRLVLAALGPRMQRLAAAEADGVILNFLSAGDTASIVALGKETERRRDERLEVITRVFLVPGSGPASELAARRHLAAYLNVPVYAEFQRWLGRASQLDAMWKAWEQGDRRAAVRAIPDAVVQDLIVTGDAATCGRAVAGYAAEGVDCTIISVMAPFDEPMPPSEHLDFVCQVAAAARGV